MTRRQFQWVRWHCSQREIGHQFLYPAAGNAGKSYREILSNSIKVKSSELWNITLISLFHIQTLRGRVAQVYLLTNLSIEFIFLPPVLGQSSRPYKKFSCYGSSCFPFLTPSQGPCCTKYQCAAPPQRMSPCWQTPALLLDCSCWRPTASWRDTRTSRRCTGSCATTSSSLRMLELNEDYQLQSNETKVHPQEEALWRINRLHWYVVYLSPSTCSGKHLVYCCYWTRNAIKMLTMCLKPVRLGVVWSE